MRDFHPDDDFASPEEYVPQTTPDDFDPGFSSEVRGNRYPIGF